ncbi:MAG TPA: hypothetical protein VKZ80_02045 [Flavobacterium sp.]|nr:hypothetical protein [Flavobacterium sp.]
MKTLCYSICLIYLLIGCDKEKPIVNDKKINLQEYFQIDTTSFNNQNFYLINKILDIKENDGLEADLELRLVSSKDFKDHIYYRYIYDGRKWRGEKYTIENTTLRLIKKEIIIPKEGWVEFEKALIDTDILNLKSITYNDSYIHPRTFEMQIVTKNYSKKVDLKNFLNYENKKDSNFLKIDLLMIKLFGNDYDHYLNIN